MILVLTRGREGVQNPENLADVICERPLSGGGTWSVSCIFWGRTIGELLRSGNEEGAECLGEFNTKVCKVL